MENSDLGNLISVHGLSAAFLQRSVVIIILALFFALAMFAGFLILQKFVLLLLAAAFLAINVLTLISLLSQRKNILSLYEQGIIYNKTACRFDEIESVKGFEILTKSGGKLLLNETINDVEQAVRVIKIETGK
jgi:hypothetical protein